MTDTGIGRAPLKDAVYYFAMDSLARLRAALSPHHTAVPCTWLRRPALTPGSRVCLMVIFCPAGVVPEHSLRQFEAWVALPCEVVVLLVAPDPRAEIDTAPLAAACGILRRDNRGYDFGAWAAAIEMLPELAEAGELIIANDSVYGPVGDLAEYMRLIDARPGDVIGPVESGHLRRHFQSFMLVFRPRALTHPAFRRFWSGVRTGERATVVLRYELRLFETLAAAGLACTPVHRAVDHRNPTLTGWRRLLDEQFPFVKVQLLRDNPFGVDLSGWRELLAAGGYDPEIVIRHLGAVADGTDRRG
jgi:hypothetical protein